MADLTRAFALFSLEAAAGILVVLPAVQIREGGRRFFQVSAGLAVASLALGHGLRAATGAYAPGRIDVAGGAALGLALASVALVGAWLKVLASAAFLRARPLLVAAAALAVLAVAAEGLGVAPAAGLGAPWRAFLPLDLVSGAALVGSATLAMLLGHFYLVIPRLSIDPLARLAALYLWSSCARVAVVGAGLAATASLELPSGRPVLLEHASLVLPRALFGLGGAVLLAVLARGTVAAKATQSATGILYGAMVFVFVGELLSCWLVAAAGLPL